MKIVVGKPPIFEEAHKHFEIDDSQTFYTYGDTIYNPAGLEIEMDLVVHEKMHCLQQRMMAGGPAEWWKNYFDYPEFRLFQEVEAYAAQYSFYCLHYKDRNKQAQYLNIIAGFLTSPMYGLKLTTKEATRLIKHSPTPSDDTLLLWGSALGTEVTLGEGINSLQVLSGTHCLKCHMNYGEKHEEHDCKIQTITACDHRCKPKLLTISDQETWIKQQKKI